MGAQPKVNVEAMASLTKISRQARTPAPSFLHIVGLVRKLPVSRASHTLAEACAGARRSRHQVSYAALALPERPGEPLCQVPSRLLTRDSPLEARTMGKPGIPTPPVFWPRINGAEHLSRGLAACPRAPHSPWASSAGLSRASSPETALSRRYGASSHHILQRIESTGERAGGSESYWIAC